MDELPPVLQLEKATVKPEGEIENSEDKTYRWWEKSTKLGNLESAFKIGANIGEACHYAGITRDQFDYYCEVVNLNYRKKVDLWRHNPALVARQSVYKGLKDDPKIALDYLRLKNPDEFRSRHENINAEIDINALVDKMETNYATVAGEAQKQMVEAQPFVQDQGQTGKPDNVQA